MEFSTETTRWQAVLERDRSANGTFVYGVVSTGVYCRPHCASRRPKRDNVRFFDTPGLAEQAGFRPCKRCTPQAQSAPNRAVDAVARACALLEQGPCEPSLHELAEATGVSPAHLQRVFKKTLGVSPKQYAMEKRMERMRQNLRSEGSITKAVYSAGFESGSRFYEQADAALGMKPSEFRSGGTGKTISFAVAQSFLGLVLVAATELGICRIDFGESPETLASRLKDAFPGATLVERDPALETRLAQALACVDEPERAADFPLDVRGTAFQRQVWAALQDIPSGSRTTYAEIAARIGKPGAVRAVGRACATNSIAVAIPCHRVVRSDGTLAGYRWGIDRKRALLEKESAADT